jgi:cyanamide hydratase
MAVWLLAAGCCCWPPAAAAAAAVTVKENLPPETYNHCMRVYYYGTSPTQTSDHRVPVSMLMVSGQAMTIQYFPTLHYIRETLLFAAMLHDIGSTPSNMSSTRLSFEFTGNIIALDLLKSPHAEIAQAESVCETIIRHEDLGEPGNVSTLTAVIHLATVLGNAGLHAELVAIETIESVVTVISKERLDEVFCKCDQEAVRAQALGECDDGAV